jgi:hypothetical protein
MRKTWALGICLFAVIAATACEASGVSASPGSRDRQTEQPSFTVFTHMVEAHVVAPCPGCAAPPLPSGSKVRDEYVNDPVFDQETGGNQIGREALVIDIVSSDGSTALLSGVLNFTGGGRSGQLAVSGEIDARASSGAVVVTGGTGEFQGAVGEIDYSGAGLASHVTTLVIRLSR